MTTQERIEAILADGSIIPAADLPAVLYVTASENPLGASAVAGSMGDTIVFDVDALKDMDDDALAPIVRHELLHHECARMAGAPAPLLITIPDARILPGCPVPDGDWNTALKHVSAAAIAPTHPPVAD